MLNLERETRVYLFCSHTDMRCSFDRLTSLVEEYQGLRVMSGGLYVFLSRKRDKVKILYWDNDGYVLWYKRLEAGTFKVRKEDNCERITGVDLKLLLRGMELSRIKFRKKTKEGVYSDAA